MLPSLLISWFSESFFVVILRLGAFQSISEDVESPYAHVPTSVTCFSLCNIKWKCNAPQLLWAEPTSLHPQRTWSSYTNINQGKPTGWTHTVEAGVWVSTLQQAHVIEVYLGILPTNVSYDDCVELCSLLRQPRQACHTCGTEQV